MENGEEVADDRLMMNNGLKLKSIVTLPSLSHQALMTKVIIISWVYAKGQDSCAKN